MEEGNIMSNASKMVNVGRLNVINNHLAVKNRLNLVPVSGLLREGARHFKYTLNGDFLTYEQRCFYEDNGFLIIKNLADDELMEKCRQRFVDLCEGRVEKGGMVLMKDISLMKSNAKGEYLYNKAHDIHYDPIFEKYVFYPKIIDIVSSFIGPNIMATNSMLINKPPDAGSLTSRHPMHQDLYYFPFRPADRIVASWTAMETINEANGCLLVIPGSHKAGELYQHEYPNWEGGVNKAYHGVKGFDNHPTVNLIMEKGDTVFFHPLLIHGSGMNSTKGFRKAISCHYAASECYYIDVNGTIQDYIAREVEAIAARRGADITMQEVWQLKSRLVRGEQITL